VKSLYPVDHLAIMSTRRAFESALRPTSSPLELSDNHTVSELTEERDRTGAFGIQRLPRGLSKGLTDEVVCSHSTSSFPVRPSLLMSMILDHVCMIEDPSDSGARCVGSSTPKGLGKVLDIVAEAW